MNFDLNLSDGDDFQISSMEWGFIDQMSQPNASTNRDCLKFGLIKAILSSPNQF